MTLVSLGQAAKLTGLGKSTITRSIKAGRLSAARTVMGSYEIDTAELFRVYPFKPPQEPAGETDATGVVASSPVHQATPDVAPLLEAQIAALRQVAELLRDQLDDIKQEREDLKKDRDGWREQASRLVLPASESPPARKSLWRRLVG